MKIKVGNTLYDFPSRPLELGEQRRLKREFGLVPGRDELDLRDPDHLAAFLYAAIREDKPDAPAGQVMALIDRTREIEIVDDDGQPLPDSDDDSGNDAMDPTPTPESPESDGGSAGE